MEIWKKHWTTVLGAMFVLTSLISLFKYSSDQGWLNDSIKVAIGLLLGAAAGGIGLALHRRSGAIALAGEVIAGLGAAVLYTTSAYAGIYAAIWESMTVLVVMTVITAAIAMYAYRQQSRLLMMVSLAGAMIAPLVMRPETDQVLQLFLYLLVMNSAVFAISVLKGWKELRWTSFLFTWLLYGVYYIHFMPESDGIWSMPMRYAVAAFMFYLIAFYAAAWREKGGYSGADIYFSFFNTVLLGVWASALLPGRDAMTGLLIFIGILYSVLAFTIYRFQKDAVSGIAAGSIHGVFGVAALLIGLSGLGSGSEYKPLVAVIVWTAVAAGSIGMAKKVRSDGIIAAASLIWLCTGVYWFMHAWSVPRVNPISGLYLPFLNGGAGAWTALALFGFYVSKQVQYKSLDKASNAVISVLHALLSHFVVGGLLTVQIMNVFEEYDLSGRLNLALTAVWGIYALLLFLWGAFSRQRAFRWFGSIVLVLVTLKAILSTLR